MILRAGLMQRQRGVAMLIVMVILLMVTGLGIASVRTLSLQERMTANALDRTLALQSARRVMLAVAFDIVRKEGANTPPNPGFPSASPGTASCIAADPPASDDPTRCTTAGLCLAPGKDCASRWEDPSFANWVTVTSTTNANPYSAGGTDDAALSNQLQQQYFVEYLGSNFRCYVASPSVNSCMMYRITVRTNTGSQRAVVQLQSHVIVEKFVSSGLWTSYTVSHSEIVN